MRFKVVGSHRVAGSDRGEHIELDPGDPRTRALVRAGHIVPDPADEPAKPTRATSKKPAKKAAAKKAAPARRRAPERRDADGITDETGDR